MADSEEDITSQLDALIGEVEAGAGAQLNALAVLATSDDKPVEWRNNEKGRIAQEVDEAFAAWSQKADAALLAAGTKAMQIRYNPGDPAEMQRAADMGQAEIASRMKLPPGQIENALLGALAAGNARQASVHLMTLQLMGETTGPRWVGIRDAVEKALDEALPHRKAAIAVETAAADASRKFQIASAAARARLSMVLGEGEDAAKESITAKMLSWDTALRAGTGYEEPLELDASRHLNKSLVPSSKKDARGVQTLTVAEE